MKEHERIGGHPGLGEQVVVALALPLAALALLVGWSRVVLGVHYPGDVVMGQMIAVATALVVYGVM